MCGREIYSVGDTAISPAFYYLCNDLSVTMHMMKNILRLLCATALLAVTALSCSKKDDDGAVYYSQKALFLDWGETARVGISGVNIATFSVSSVPDGWDTPEIDLSTLSMIITAPEEGSDAKTTGSIVLRGQTYGGEFVSASLFVSLATPEIDMSSAPANCYIANAPNTQYLIDATRKGDGSSIATKRVAVIWQTSQNLIRYLNLQLDGKAFFFIDADTNDETIVKRGNALIGAYDAADNLLWSWHIWVTDFDPDADALQLGDYELMSRQLGALQNGNADNTAIWHSYGLYYQWGRKDPFVGPADYSASRGTTATLFDGDSNTVRIGMVESSASTGTYAYTNANPLDFVTTTSNSADWRVGSESNAAWTEANNPCPYGWKVAPADAFAGLSIADDLTGDAASYEKRYGWNLTDGTTTSFFFAAGRRIYADGMIQNIFDESIVRSSAIEAQPWVGYNWATTAAGGSTVFCYWFKKAAPAESGLRTDLQLGRANGLSVRCVRK